MEMIDEQIEQHLERVPRPRTTAPRRSPSGPAACCRVELDPREFRGLDFETAAAHLPRTRPSGWPRARCSTPSKKTCPREKTAEWNWEALAKFANTRWKPNLRDRDLKKIGRDGVAEMLIDEAREAIGKIDLSEGAKFLEADFGVRTACGWVQYKFGIELDPDEVRELEPAATRRAWSARRPRGLRREGSRISGDGRAVALHDPRRHRPEAVRPRKLVAWARERFHVEF